MPSDGQPPPPQLWQADLDAERLDELFGDLAQVGPVHIVVRHKAHKMVLDERAEVTLAHARELLGDGKAVQIRYRHEGVEWWDTLTPRGDTVRLVRVRHEFPE